MKAAPGLLKSPYRRVVVKLGTALLTGGSNQLDEKIMADLVRQVAQLHQQGLELVVVTSGAIAAGREKLGLPKEIRGIPFKQVLASVGQGRLMNVYEQLFSQHSITVAQALLTKADLSDRAGYLNARNTLLALLELRALCIINENDVVAVEEIEEAKFGDNDNLSAMVALVPLTGVPLPFISYGGSSLVVILAGMGILINISKHRVVKK